MPQYEQVKSHCFAAEKEFKIAGREASSAGGRAEGAQTEAETH